MAKINVKPQYKGIMKLFDSLTGSRSLYQVFSDFVIIAACTIHNTVGSYKADEKEKTYLNIIQNYKDEDLEIFAKILAEITMLAEENPFQDLLGDLYMQLNMGSDAMGQFFTPYSVSLAMARTAIDIGEAKELINKKGYITISEPAVGGGANIIAACQVLKEVGINYQTKAVIVAQELNQLTALMAYIAFSLLGIPAVIKIGDTLRDPYTNVRDEMRKKSNIWITPQMMMTPLLWVV